MGTEITLTVDEQLLAIESVKNIFAGRLRCMDNKQWELYPTLHTEDGISETWGGAPIDRKPQTDGVANRVVGVRAVMKDTWSADCWTSASHDRWRKVHLMSVSTRGHEASRWSPDLRSLATHASQMFRAAMRTVPTS